MLDPIDVGKVYKKQSEKSFTKFSYTNKNQT